MDQDIHKKLFWAIMHRNPDEVKKIISEGADVNHSLIDNLVVPTAKKGDTPLMTAARCRQMDIMKILVEQGADVNFMGSESVRTPLMIASYLSGLEFVNYLIAQGADVNAQGKFGQSALNEVCGDTYFYQSIDDDDEEVRKRAVKETITGIIRALVNNGADVNHQDGSRFSPLMKCAETRELPLEAVSILLDAGANINARDFSGKSVLEIAEDAGHIGFKRLAIAKWECRALSSTLNDQQNIKIALIF